ncbi:hypothetical protein D3C83_171330 [compost metagenome]
MSAGSSPRIKSLSTPRVARSIKVESSAKPIGARANSLVEPRRVMTSSMESLGIS